jgi:hypothetical protein
MSDRILPGDNAARARYATLTTALGGEPSPLSIERPWLDS